MSEIKSEIIKILLAIPRVSLCNGIKAIFSPCDDIQVVGELDNFENLAGSVKSQLPEILIVSINEKNPLVFDLIKTIKMSHPEVSVIIMLENFEDELVYAVLGLGVSACLSTGAGSEELITCIRKVWHDENPIFDELTRPEIARLIVKDMDSDLNGDISDAADTRKSLSDREREILLLVADGYTLDQIIPEIDSNENDVIHHFTGIYGKIVFNSYFEYSAQPLEESVTYDQSRDVNLLKDNTNTQTLDLYNSEKNVDRVDDIRVNEVPDEYTSYIWKSFEALKNDLQETLETLTPVDNYPAKSPEKQNEEAPGNNEDDSTKIKETDEHLTEVMTETQNHTIGDLDTRNDSGTSIPDAENIHNETADTDVEDTRTLISSDESLSSSLPVSHEPKNYDFDIIDDDYNSQSENISEDVLPVKENTIQNSKSATNQFAVNNDKEKGEILQDTLETTKEQEVKENVESVKQKSGWFRFSLKRENKIDIENNKPSKVNDSPKNTAVSEKPGLNPRKEPDVADDKKEIPEKTNEDSKITTQTGHRYSQEELLSSVQGLGVPVFIKSPVDGKQLERLESIIKRIDSLNIILRKGTAQEHVLVISAREPANLLKILSDIPLVENASDESGRITIKLLTVADMDDRSQVQ